MYGTNYKVTTQDGRMVMLYNCEAKVSDAEMAYPFPFGFYSKRHEAGQWFDKDHVDNIENVGDAKFWHPLFKVVK